MSRAMLLYDNYSPETAGTFRWALISGEYVFQCKWDGLEKEWSRIDVISPAAGCREVFRKRSCSLVVVQTPSPGTRLCQSEKDPETKMMEKK